MTHLEDVNSGIDLEIRRSIVAINHQIIRTEEKPQMERREKVSGAIYYFGYFQDPS